VITYPPHMLPSPDVGQEADVIVQSANGSRYVVHSTDQWPRRETCAECGRFGTVWWWDTKPWGYRCGACADPEGLAEFRKTLKQE